MQYTHRSKRNEHAQSTNGFFTQGRARACAAPKSKVLNFKIFSFLSVLLLVPPQTRGLVGNDNYHSFSGDSYFSRLFWVLSARFFGVFLGWFSAFAGAGFRPPGGEATEGRRQRRVGGILRA